MADPLRVTVWNENRHEQIHDEVKKIYPNGMHNVIAHALRSAVVEDTHGDLRRAGTWA